MGTLVGLYAAGQKFGGKAIMVHYFFPYLGCNFWLVLYTWLQHADPMIPHYGDDEFTWVKGALCTIDRPYALKGFLRATGLVQLRPDVLAIGCVERGENLPLCGGLSWSAVIQSFSK